MKLTSLGTQLVSALLLVWSNPASCFTAAIPIAARRHAPSLRRQLRPLMAVDLPPPTEDGGPLSILLKSKPSDRSRDPKIGEDAGTFDFSNEKMGELGERDWLTFFAAVGAILSVVALVWVVPSTGYSDDFVAALEELALAVSPQWKSHIVTLAFGILFPIVHSGLASLRPYGEKVVGTRMWRVIFAFPSLCLSYSWIAYYVAHAHDGLVLWDGTHVAAAHGAAWLVNFVSFFFLYPSVFNLKEVAAVEKPQLHLWETGVMRITRHPQMAGQVMWSAGHLAMVGSTFNALTMALLVSHHLFACWNGDRRLLAEHGDDFVAVRERTSVTPFAAVLDGRQQLPPDYWKEWARAPYALIAVGTLGAYAAHPYMQAGAALVRNTGLVPGGVLDGLFT